MLETVDIQNTNEGVSVRENLLGSQTLVRSLDQPVEQTRVDELGNGVSHDYGLLLRQVRHDLLASCDQLLLDRPFRKVVGINSKQSASLHQCRLVRRKTRICARRCDLDVSNVQQRRKKAEDLRLGSLRNTNLCQRALCRLELGLVVHAIDDRCATLVEIAKVFDRLQRQLLSLSIGGTGHKLVEDVVIPLLKRLKDQSRPFQQVCPDLRTNDVCLLVEHDLDVFAEAGGVVVSRGFGVTEGFHDRVGGQDLLFCLGHGVDLASSLAWVVWRLACRKVSHDVFGADGLTRTRLSRDDDGLVLLVSQHVAVGVLALTEVAGAPATLV